MDVLARTKELFGSLVDVTESGLMIARYKIEVANIDRKLGVLMRRVGLGPRGDHHAGRGRDGFSESAFGGLRNTRN